MKVQSDKFLWGENEQIEVVGEGIKRQMLGFNDEIMMAKVWFDAGGIGDIHNHEHSQASYIESGEFEVNIDGEIQTLRAGDAFYIPPNVSHGAVCKSAGVLIDTFSPVREDFVQQDESE